MFVGAALRAACRVKAPARKLHTKTRPFRLAVIGSGPAGFYAAYRVMARVENSIVDMYEQLPVPFGLVRFGVAPDHPEVKNCQEKFEEVASSARFNFAGNVELGKDIDLPTLRENYDAVLFAYGASRDRTLGIPGEALRGVHSARAFVGWYNGLPEYANLNPDLQSGDTAVIIGQGNVALDVARILLSNVDRLRSTDITEEALDALAKSTIKRVHIVGRRGPMQASFTIKELRELMQLPSVAFEPLPTDLLPPKDLKLPRPRRRIADLMIKHSALPVLDNPARLWSLNFMLSPTEFQGLESLSSIEFERNEYLGDPFEQRAKIKGGGPKTTIETSLAFRSIGYKSAELVGLGNLGVAFDNSAGIIPNENGRVVAEGKHVPGLYCAGWVKNGPTGVIASTMEDAFSTAELIAEDWGSQSSEKHGLEALRLPGAISWDDWLKIDKAERQRGAKAGKEREKFTSTAEMLAAVR